MNTQIESTLPVAEMPATVPTAPAGETYADYPSQHITDMPDGNAHSLDPYTLTDLDMRCIFEKFQHIIEMSCRDDEDGEQFEIDYKVYRIEAVHHYKTHAEEGGDSYCGIWEMVGILDEDRIEIVRIFDEDGIDYRQLVEQLNEYAKRNNI
ncbi:MAG: hypothetical protein NC226_09615 [Bacteroides cellulosilyticus]|nr:hypothetical protein [Bacteroides cellulosilyticus]